MNQITDAIIFSFLFFIPAGIANSTPVYAAYVPILKKFDQPIDFGLKIGGVRIFGDHKTIRGFICGTLTAIVTAYAVQYLFINIDYFQEISLINYSTVNPAILGFLLGFGALLGDAIKSFFKRRTSIPPGKSWFPFDQLDYIIGGLALSALYIQLPIQYYLIIAVVFFLLHLISNYVGFLTGIRKDPI